MNLLLRTHEGYNDPTWSVIIGLIIFLAGVTYYIVYIMRITFDELDYGNNDTTESEELLQLPSDKINRVVDGDTIDVTIDLGFDLYKKERVRVAGVDTPEKRTRDKEEKVLGIDATNWLKERLEVRYQGRR